MYFKKLSYFVKCLWLVNSQPLRIIQMCWQWWWIEGELAKYVCLINQWGLKIAVRVVCKAGLLIYCMEICSYFFPLKFRFSNPFPPLSGESLNELSEHESPTSLLSKKEKKVAYQFYFARSLKSDSSKFLFLCFS